MKRWYFCFLLALASLAIVPARLEAEEPSSLRSPREPADEHYERAIAIRSKSLPSWAEQQKAVELLVAASGFRSQRHGRAFPFNGTLPCPGDGDCTQQPQQQQDENGEAAGPVVLEGSDTAVSIAAGAHRGALRELAKAFQDGWGVSQDLRLALQLFRAASDRGDPEAQGHMGLRYAVGLDQLWSWGAEGIVAFGQPKPSEALLHYYFGALGGDMASRLALGYRHLMGMGVPQACWTAASYYQAVGEQVSDLAAGLDPFAHPVPPSAAASSTVGSGSGSGDGVRGSSSGGGGGGGVSSGAPDGLAARRQATSGSLPHVERIRLHLQAAQGGMRSERHREMVQYYQYSADRGNTEAQTAVGQVLNYGTLGMDRDHAAALSYFKLAAEANDVDAMAHLGSMYANGYGTEQSYDKAVEWWTLAAKRHSGSALFGLGYLHLTGRGVAQDHDKAFQYFSKAADQVQSDARPDAWFYMGVMHLRGYGVRRKSVQRALTYFQLAAQAGHPLAQYNAAMMHLAGRGTARNCKGAVTLLKTLAEKGPSATDVQRGHEHFFRGRYGLALLSYLRAADMGFEVAQSNAAWMLDRGYAPGANSSELAFSLYQQSAAQSNVHSLLCMGDAYFYGRGVKQDWVRSAAIYYEAYQERSPEAMFNLGFMHEFGVGVPKDLQLAGKFYNMAVHTQPDAFLPVAVAKSWLRVHRWWDAARPYLPPWLWSCVFALHPPHTSLFGPWVARLQAALPNLALVHAEVVFWRWVDLTGLGQLGALVRHGGAGDAGEGATLLALLGGLALVVRLRRRRAAGRLQQQEAAARLLQLHQDQQLQQWLVQAERRMAADAEAGNRPGVGGGGSGGGSGGAASGVVGSVGLAAESGAAAAAVAAAEASGSCGADVTSAAASPPVPAPAAAKETAAAETAGAAGPSSAGPSLPGGSAAAAAADEGTGKASGSS